MEAQLSGVKAQEVEIKAIADEHLAREVALKQLLGSLYKKDQVCFVSIKNGTCT